MLFATRKRPKFIFTLVILLGIGLLVGACDSKEDTSGQDRGVLVPLVELPQRESPRPETTPDVPHVQIDVEPVPDVHEELFRRVYAIPGLEDRPSVVAAYNALWISEELDLHVPGAVFEDSREYAHIHGDGSLHIFLAPSRADEAVETGWAVLHPFAVEGRDGWDGFVMLYTPLTLDELDVTFQLIVDGYNYVTGQAETATDYYD